jgi:hypothetical protein
MHTSRPAIPSTCSEPPAPCQCQSCDVIYPSLASFWALPGCPRCAPRPRPAPERLCAPLAQQSGLNREALYRTLSAKGNPELSSLDKLLQAMGLRLSVEVQAASRDEPAVSAPEA